MKTRKEVIEEYWSDMLERIGYEGGLDSIIVDWKRVLLDPTKLSRSQHIELNKIDRIGIYWSLMHSHRLDIKMGNNSWIVLSENNMPKHGVEYWIVVNEDVKRDIYLYDDGDKCFLSDRDEVLLEDVSHFQSAYRPTELPIFK